MKLNNKGFAITSMIYMLLVLFLMIMLLILANLAQRKIVLDKIKNDVKQELNQGGVIAQKIYTVTFDPTIGQINQTSKQVKLNEPYGELPTPTREGYRFLGWRGKNLFTGLVKGVKINTVNGNIESDQTYATSEYIEVNVNSNSYFLSGLSSDLWSYVTFYNENKEYMGRTGGGSRNSIGIQSTSIMDSTKTNVEGKIKYIRITQYVNPVYSTGTIDDIDNLQIQLEQGDTATSYEPYLGNITSNMMVTRQANHTLRAIWEKKESTFIAGPDFNAKIKQLAGNSGATKDTDDTNITSIQRANSLPNIELTNNNIVSTNDSNTPTYMWYDNGTLYYYSEAEKIYMNTDARYMFNKILNANTIDVGTIDTSKTQDMRFLFQNCSSLENIDLKSFNVENVTLMSHMFYSCESLQELDLSSFNTTHGTANMFANCTNLKSINLGSNFDVSESTSTRNMFYRCNSLESLDLSSFHMANITDVTGMIDGSMSSLHELKTPKVYPSDMSVTIDLPKTMYDSSNNSYTTLGSGSPTETLLKDTQTNQ